MEACNVPSGKEAGCVHIEAPHGGDLRQSGQGLES